MGAVDLNIVERGQANSEWMAKNTPLSSQDLDKVIEQKTDNSGALNSLPTPFARFFVAKEAFRRVGVERLDPNKGAGFAYKQMVSSILDVYELLFNLKYHENNTWNQNGAKVELLEWDSQAELENIRKHKSVLYNSLNEYYNDDIKLSKLHFLVYSEDGHNTLLACTSPYTGFVTPPDMDKAKKGGNTGVVFANNIYDRILIKRKPETGGIYFRDIKLFDERDPDFMNYMFQLFSEAGINDDFTEIREYIRAFATHTSIRTDFTFKSKEVVTDNNNPLIINGLAISANDEIDVMSMFTDHLIKVPYKISQTKFRSIPFNGDKDYDYLMPFKAEVFNLFGGNFPEIKLHEGRQQNATVTLVYNGREYTKEYDKDHTLDLIETSINFDLGLFPNILSDKASENNYFKVLVVGSDEDPEPPYFDIDKISLKFYREDDGAYNQIHEIDPTRNATFGAHPAVVRSRQKSDEVESGTKFYELYNTAFDLIEVTILGKSGLVKPIWETTKGANITYTYAIDLGTSNTFMSRCQNDAQGNPDTSRKPDLFTMDRPMVSYMHKISEGKQYPLVERIEGSVFEKAKTNLKTEFLPAYIDGQEYKFPIRTAICGILDKSQTPKLFDNHNIAFFYERLMANDDQEVHTDIKWKQNEKELRIFVRELLLIIKCDVLQRGGDLDRTRIVLFNPLSFAGSIRSMYKDIWESEPQDILFINPDNNVNNYSESEAPYYYYLRSNQIADNESVTVVDIGGGSTDFVYFKDNKPVVANSVHFGCDVLWENGYNSFGNAKDNGIYNRYADKLTFPNRKDLADLDICMRKVDKASTKDVINFWLSNDRSCGIIRQLHNDFKPVFLYHLTSILYYMAQMYKDSGLEAPKSIVFSGNGSKYIDNFITTQKEVLSLMVNKIFDTVFGTQNDIRITLPQERKEATCYGGLYRNRSDENVKAVVYHGTPNKYENVEALNKAIEDIKKVLMPKYQLLSKLYQEVLKIALREGIMDSGTDTNKYVKTANTDVEINLSSHFKSQVVGKFSPQTIYNDSLFFIPIVQRVFELTKI